MAILVSAATGNLTAAATWKVVHAGTFTTLRATQETAAQAVQSGTSASPNFTVSAGVTVDAILLKHYTTSAFDNQTLTIQLYNATTATVIASVVRGPGSFPRGSATPNWFQFEFASVALTTATNYQIRIVATGSSGQNSFFRKSATASDWTFGLRTTTTAAPANGDLLIVAGKYTGTGSRTDYIVANDNTNAALLLGNGVTGTSGIEVNYGSSLINNLNASTNYWLRVSGDLVLNGGSQFNCGTSNGTKLPQTSTATFEIYQPTAGVFSWLIRSTVNAFCYVNAVEDQTNKRLMLSYLSAPIGAAATTCSVLDLNATNWRNGDEIVIGSTERNYQQVEYRTMSANETGGTVSVSSAFTYAHAQYHDSWNQVSVPVVNLTKNIIFKGTSTTLRTGNMTSSQYTYMYMSGVMFQNWGQITIDPGYGTDVDGNTDIYTWQYFYDIVYKDYSGGFRLGGNNRNPKDVLVSRLACARPLVSGTIAMIVANNTEGATVSYGFNVYMGDIYSFGGTGTVDGRVLFQQRTSNVNNYWYWSSVSSFGPGIGIYINGLNGTGISGTPFPFQVDGGVTNRDTLDFTVDFYSVVSACQNWGGGIAIVTDGWQPWNYWWGLRAIKNDGTGIAFRSVSDQPISHQDIIAEQNSGAQLGVASTANTFMTTLYGVYLGASATNPGTGLFTSRYVVNCAVNVEDVVGASFSPLLVSISTTDGEAIGGATKVNINFSPVISSTIAITKTQFVGVATSPQFTTESQYTITDNSGNEYTYLRDAVIYKDAANYYLNGPSTVFDTTGQVLRPVYQYAYTPSKKFVVPKGKAAKVGVWVYNFGAATVAFSLQTLGDDLSQGSSLLVSVPVGTWTRLTSIINSSSTVDRFFLARLQYANSYSNVQIRMSDWGIELT